MEIPKSFYRDVVGIGVELTGERGNRSADIERTLLAASGYVDSSERSGSGEASLNRAF